MPEGPEVLTFITELNQEFGGQTLQRIKVVGGRFVKEAIANHPQITFPLHNTQFHCKGKFIYWTFAENISVLMSLGMSGSFGDYQKHSAIEFQFENKSIYFNDPRHFGSFKIELGNKELTTKLNSLGWDPLVKPYETLNDTEFLFWYDKFFSKSDKTIAETLLDQSLFAGCGNYLKSDACYLAGIDPLRLKSTLSLTEIKTLCQRLSMLMRESFDNNGGTIATYKNMHDQKGGYQFKVYNRKADDLGNKVFKSYTKDKRSTYYVPGLQK